MACGLKVPYGASLMTTCVTAAVILIPTGVYDQKSICLNELPSDSQDFAAKDELHFDNVYLIPRVLFIYL